MCGELDVGSAARVMPGEYEVIALNDEDKHVYTRLDNDCMLNGLHSALQRYHSAEGE